MIYRILLVCGALLTGLLFIYSVAERSPRADFTYVNPSGIHTLDPARMSWLQDFRIALNLWEGLTVSHPETTRPVAGAAMLPPRVTDDGLTHTFSIRRDARWSNGDPVNARDFVRGWRRAMEPGTAADYLFLFTDHIAGAAEYVEWRLERVALLTGLLRLSQGWAIDAAQARAVAAHPPVGRILPAAGVPDARAATADATFDRLAKQLGELEVDWRAVHERTLRQHAAQMDDRFSAVGVRAIDGRTLAVELKRPCPYFLDLTAFPTFLPCHESVELLRETSRGVPLTAEGLVVYDPQWTKPDCRRQGYAGLVTNGPFRMASWRFKRRARLEVNPYYREALRIACRTVDMVVFEHPSSALMAYEAGDVDFLPGIDVPYDHEIARLARTGKRPDFRFCNALATFYFNFNCVSDAVLDRVNPFVDARVRKAFALAMDREAIVAEVLQRGDRVARSLVPRGAIEGYDPPEGVVRDVTRAARLLADSGHAGGADIPPVDLLCLPSDQRVCQAAAATWEQTLGVRVDIRFKESKTFAHDKANLQYMIARGNWFGDYADPTTFLDCLVTGNGNNDSGYSNPRYDALVAQARDCREPPRRLRLLAQAEKIIVEEDLPLLTVLHYSIPIAVKPYVKGLHANPRLRFSFKDLRVER